MKCAYCGEEFEPKIKDQRYCSRDCSNKDYYLRMKQQPARVVKCAWCGEEFKTHYYQQKYCSEECRKAARNEQTKEYFKKHKLPTVWKPARRVCLTCGREFTEHFRGDKFCSDECCLEYYPARIKYALVKTFVEEDMECRAVRG